MGIDTASQSVPEGFPDETGETSDGVFVETRFVEDDALAAVVFGEGEFLEEVG